jgi:hypothetical protein
VLLVGITLSISGGAQRRPLHAVVMRLLREHRVYSTSIGPKYSTMTLPESLLTVTATMSRRGCLNVAINLPMGSKAGDSTS